MRSKVLKRTVLLAPLPWWFAAEQPLRATNYWITGWKQLLSNAGRVSWLKTSAMLLALGLTMGCHPVIAQIPPYSFAPNPVDLGPPNAFFPYVCQTTTCAANNAGAEILYTNALTSGTCTRIWTESINGTNQTNLSFSYSGLPAVSTHNHGNGHWSPDGTWFLMQAQDSGTSRACTSTGAGVGQGLGHGLFACKVATTMCYELAIQGDNTGHFCPPGVACPVQASLVNYVDDKHGVLQYYFTPDQTKIYGMYIMGTGHSPEQEKINGTLRWATITLGAPPTLSNVTETDVGPLGDGTGTYNWYEGAGAMPIGQEPSSCTIFATGVGNGDGTLVHTQIVRYNICNQTYAWLSPNTCYQEFWSVRPQGDIGAGPSSCYLPSTLTPGEPPPYYIAGPSDLAYGGATTGKTTQLTFFNNRNPFGNPITTMSQGSWDWTGTVYVSSYIQSANDTHLPISSSILMFKLVTGAVSIRGNLSIQGNVKLGQ